MRATIRVLKSIDDGQGFASSNPIHSAETFATLRLDGVAFDGTQYVQPASSQAVYLVMVAKGPMPRLDTERPS